MGMIKSSISLQGVTAGCLCISGLGGKKGAERVSPVLNPAPVPPPTPRSVVIGLLLPTARALLAAKLVQLFPSQTGF